MGSVVIAEQSARPSTDDRGGEHAPVFVQPRNAGGDRANGKKVSARSGESIMRHSAQQMQVIIALCLTLSSTVSSARLLPVGGPFQVNTTGPLTDPYPEIAFLSSGQFAIIWADLATNDSPRARIFSDTSEPLGSEFILSGADPTYAVAGIGGDIAVAWLRENEVQVAQYSSQPLPVASGALQTMTPINVYYDFGFAGLSDGGLVGLWTVSGNLLGQRLAGDLDQVGPPFLVAGPGVVGANPSVSEISEGQFIATWVDRDSVLREAAIRARLFDLDGRPNGDPFDVVDRGDLINSFAFPQIRVGPSSEFIISWHDDGPQQFRRYSSSAASQTPSLNTGIFSRVPPSYLADGELVAAGLGAGVLMLRAFDAQNRSVGQAVLDPGHGLSSLPAITALSGGEVMATWGSCASMSNECTILAQRFTVDGELDGVGDCNADAKVTVDELVAGIRIALGSGDHQPCRDTARCPAMDANLDCSVTVDEILSAVGVALNG